MRENPFSDLLDEIDRLGLTPLEIGAVQAAIERVAGGPDGRGCVEVLLQAAFAGPVWAELRLVAHDPPDARLEADPPRARAELADGEVKRVSLPFAASANLAKLRCMVESPRSQVGGAPQRVRPPWRLLDTVVQPEDVPVSAVDLLPVGLVSRVTAQLRDGDKGGRSEGTRTERARLTPDFLVADVTREPRRVDGAFEEEIVWQPGMEPAQAPAAADEPEWRPATEQARETRQCPDCGSHIDLSRARDLGMCPSCGARWIED